MSKEPSEVDKANSRAQQSPSLFADEPITTENQDLLDRARFARGVVSVLRQSASQASSSVVALIGAWGSGKTSLLNLVPEGLSQDECKVVTFNPWQAPDLEGITRDFFVTLREALPDERSGKNARKAIARYASAVGPWAALIRGPVDVSKALENISKVLATTSSIAAEQSNARASLSDLPYDILVVIDDVDRLFPEELLLLFKLIRLVGNLPNVYYLLAYDEETLLHLIQQTDLATSSKDRAKAYLEKIVQIRMDVPPLHPKTAARLLDSALDHVLQTNETPLSESESRRFGMTYHAHLKAKLQEPRGIRRYVAQVEATLPLLRDEVNHVDLLILTFFRVFYPEVYRAIGRAKDDLTNTLMATVLRRETSNQAVTEEWKDRLQKLGVPANELDHVLKTLSELFLPIRSAVENTSYADDFYTQLAADQRIGAESYFDRYFQFGLPPDDISDDLVRIAVDEIRGGTPGDASRELARSFGSEPNLAIDKLMRYEASLSPQERSLLTSFLASVYAALPEERDFFISPRTRVELWAGLLLRNSDGTLNVEELLAHPDGLTFLAVALDRAKSSYQEEGAEEPEWFGETVGTIVTRVSEAFEAAAQRPIKESEDFMPMLFVWGRLSDPEEVARWVLAKIEGDAPWTAEDLAAVFVPIATVMGAGLKRLAHFSHKEFQKFIPDEKARELIDFSGVGDEDLHELEKDTSFEGRRAYALRVLKRQLEVESPHEEQGKT